MSNGMDELSQLLIVPILGLAGLVICGAIYAFTTLTGSLLIGIPVGTLFLIANIVILHLTFTLTHRRSKENDGVAIFVTMMVLYVMIIVYGILGNIYLGG